MGALNKNESIYIFELKECGRTQANSVLNGGAIVCFWS